jgi:hypothetical protein
MYCDRLLGGSYYTDFKLLCQMEAWRLERQAATDFVLGTQRNG